jgi:chromosome segregation ATPase
MSEEQINTAAEQLTRELNDEVGKSHVDSDLNLYTRKVDGLRQMLAENARDIAQAEANVAGWTRNLQAAQARRERVEKTLRATRVAQRAMEDAKDGI